MQYKTTDQAPSPLEEATEHIQYSFTICPNDFRVMIGTWMGGLA